MLPISTGNAILASRPRGTLYVGITNGLIFRSNKIALARDERSRANTASTCWSGTRNSPDVREAIQREKTIKHNTREWKINLIERTNPHWIDLYPTLPGVAPVPALLPPQGAGSSEQVRG